MSVTPIPYTLVHQVERHANGDPDGVGLVFRGERFTWAQLRDRANRVAHVLASSGVRRGDRVAMVLSNRPEFIDLVMGINRLGAIAVPVNFRLTPFEIAYVLTDSGASVVVSESGMGLNEATREAIAMVEHPVQQLVMDEAAIAPAIGYDGLVAAASTEPLPWPATMDDVSLILYTSGTTGRPKGATVTYGALAAQSLNTVTSLGLIHEDDVMVGAMPLFHIAGVAFFLPAMQFGVRLVLAPTGALDVEALLDLMEEESATMFGMVPTVWQDICLSPTLKDRTLKLRSLMWGAAPATPQLLRLMFETFPGSTILTSFGMTETLSSLVLHGEHAIERFGSVGKPLPTLQIRVVDDAGDDVAPGEVGEIVYRGPTVTTSYWNNPAATEEAWRGGWFHSGDLVKRDEDGFVYVVDRLKDMIISGGENIYCAEVEAAIGEHPKVRDAAVVGKPDERWGEVPVAFVCSIDPADPVTAEEIIALCEQRLAAYKRPKDIRFVDDFPRTSTGKIQKMPLRDLVR
jgi:fatty-acyl-CoA synthase